MALQPCVYPMMATWTAAKLQHLQTACRRGQGVAVCDGEIAGYAGSWAVLWDDWAESHTWNGSTGARTTSAATCMPMRWRS